MNRVNIGPRMVFTIDPRSTVCCTIVFVQTVSDDIDSIDIDTNERFVGQFYVAGGAR